MQRLLARSIMQRLQSDHFLIPAPFGEERFMITDFDNPATIHDQDPVCMTNGTEAMRDDK